MTEIEAIYEKYQSETKRNNKDYIDLYEANKAVIESADTSTWSIDAIYITNMTSNYALALSYYGSSRKSLPYLGKAIELFERMYESDFLSKDNSYETLRWVRGKENHNQKNYIDAEKDFRYLVENYPDNDVYKNWLVASLKNRTNRLSNFAYIGLGISLGISLSVSWGLPIVTKSVNLNLRLFFDFCGLVFLVIIFSVAIRNHLIKSRIYGK